MNRLCLMVAAVATLLSACTSTPVEEKPVTPAFDVSTAAAVPAAQLADFESRLQAGLKAATEQAAKPWLQMLVRKDGAPSWTLGDGGFRGDSGELDAAALLPLQVLAQRVSQACPCVVHVIGERVGDTTLPSSDIGERRAAAVAAVLARFGVIPGRLRYESRLVAGRAGGVDLVVVPLVEGSEQQAWTPPTLSGEAS
jgi:outer membrane protein OmpA-like peptidoglycan-associated protein